MDMSELLVALNILMAPFVGLLAFMLKKAFWKLEHTMSERDVRMLIDDKLLPQKVRHEAVELRLVRLEEKIDKILDELVHERRSHN